jgi:hypothetical protein
MKKMYTLLLALAVFSFSYATNYPGNGKSGFGGPVGTGSLDVNDDGTNIQFKLNKGSGGLNDVLVVYIDVDDIVSGFGTTAVFTDESSGFNKAISGFTSTDNGGGPGRATFIFNGDFFPEYALAFGAGSNNGGRLVRLVSGGAHTLIASPTVAGGGSSNSSAFTVNITAAQLGISGTIGFKFMATYISNSGYRAEEAVGDPMSGFSQGWNSYTSTTSPLIYGTLAPVSLSRFNGSLSGNQATLVWETASENGTKMFDIQKSINGSSFQSIGNVPATNQINGATYRYMDDKAMDAKNYYRLRIVDIDGHTEYSQMVILSKGLLKNIRILGNPVTDKININIADDEISQFKISVYSPSGVAMVTRVYNHAGGSSICTLDLPQTCSGLVYVVVSKGTDKITVPVIVQ